MKKSINLKVAFVSCSRIYMTGIEIKILSIFNPSYCMYSKMFLRFLMCANNFLKLFDYMLNNILYAYIYFLAITSNFWDQINGIVFGSTDIYHHILFLQYSVPALLCCFEVARWKVLLFGDYYGSPNCPVVG